jgi:hypothetical protein
MAGAARIPGLWQEIGNSYGPTQANFTAITIAFSAVPNELVSCTEPTQLTGVQVESAESIAVR